MGTWLVSPASREYFGIKPTALPSTFGETKFYISFFIGVTIEIAVLEIAFPVSLFDLIICSMRLETMSFSWKCCFGFYAFGFESIHHPSCYLTSIVDKTPHGPVIALNYVAVQLLNFFSYVRGVLVMNLF